MTVAKATAAKASAARKKSRAVFQAMKITYFPDTDTLAIDLADGPSLKPK